LEGKEGGLLMKRSFGKQFVLKLTFFFFFQFVFFNVILSVVCVITNFRFRQVCMCNFEVVFKKKSKVLFSF